MRHHRRLAAVGVVLLTAGLTACGPALPNTVVAGTEVRIGWAGELTSLNAAAAPTPGNIDIAEATRADFGDVVDGSFVADESFGTVAIVGDVPFTVRYDLAEPSWSDGVPLDAADLLLAWAATSGELDPEAGAEAGGGVPPEDGPVVPALDEFGRAIEVTFPEPTIAWQSVIRVAVPAHVVGERALGLDDPMEAKQAVIRAIQEQDAAALDAIAEVWSGAYDVADGTAIPADLLLSSGAYQVDRVTHAAEGQSVTLVPNPLFHGAVTPEVARIDLLPPSDDPVSAIGGSLDVVQVAPTSGNHALIRELQRRDNPVSSSHDGQVWAVLLRPAGVFATPAARTAFLRAVPARDLVSRGAGLWSSAYSTTSSMLSAPASAAYEIVSEDSGFTSALGTPSRDAALDRDAAGVAAGSSVCVLYDRGSEFAVGAFAALRDAVGAVGWNVVDCGADDIGAAIARPGWDAVIARVPIPATPAEIAAQWGTGGAASLVGDADANRDDAIAQLAQTVDVYDARELLARIESSIVRSAVALPLAVDPRVTVTDRGVAGVSVRNGPTAPLLSGIAQWSTVP